MQPLVIGRSELLEAYASPFAVLPVQELLGRSPVLSQYPIDRRNRFDELRIFAAALVIVSHCWPIFGRSGAEPFYRATGHMTAGQLAVAIFFVISGFLIYRSAVNSHPLRFVVARVLRIVPGAVVCALVTALLLGPLVTTLDTIDYFSHPKTWTYLKNGVPFSLQSNLPGVFENVPFPKAVNGSLWTLPIELRLYVLCAVLVYVFRHRAFILFALGVFGALFVFRDDILEAAGGRVYWLVYLGWYFVAGAAIYVLRERIPVHWIAAVVAVVAIAATAGTMLFPYAMAIGLPYLVIWTAFAGTAARAPRQVVDVSYGVYIYGFPIQQVFALLLLDVVPFYGLMILSLSFAFLAGWLSWHWIERPALGLKASPNSRAHGLVATRTSN